MADEKFRRAKERHWGAPVPAHLKHGTNTYAAKVYGCDCTTCLPSGKRHAARGQGLSKQERNRKLRRAKYGTPVPAHLKHGIYTAKVYGCPCDICRKANRDAANRQNAAKRQRVGKHTPGPDVTVIHWPPVGQGMWTCPDCGKQFPHRAPLEARLAA